MGPRGTAHAPGPGAWLGRRGTGGAQTLGPPQGCTITHVHPPVSTLMLPPLTLASCAPHAPPNMCTPSHAALRAPPPCPHQPCALLCPTSPAMSPSMCPPTPCPLQPCSHVAPQSCTPPRAPPSHTPLHAPPTMSPPCSPSRVPSHPPTHLPPRPCLPPCPSPTLSRVPSCPRPCPPQPCPPHAPPWLCLPIPRSHFGPCAPHMCLPPHHIAYAPPGMLCTHFGP